MCHPPRWMWEKLWFHRLPHRLPADRQRNSAPNPDDPAQCLWCNDIMWKWHHHARMLWFKGKTINMAQGQIYHEILPSDQRVLCNIADMMRALLHDVIASATLYVDVTVPHPHPHKFPSLPLPVRSEYLAAPAQVLVCIISTSTPNWAGSAYSPKHQTLHEDCQLYVSDPDPRPGSSTFSGKYSKSTNQWPTWRLCHGKTTFSYMHSLKCIASSPLANTKFIWGYCVPLQFGLGTVGFSDTFYCIHAIIVL